MILHNPQLHLLITLLNAITTKGNHNTHAVLKHLFFTPVQGHTIITATDLDLQLYWPIPNSGSGKQPSTTVNAAQQPQPLQTPSSCPIPWFLKIARTIKPGDHLEIRHDRHHLCLYPSRSPSARSPEPAIDIKECPAFTTQHFTHGGWLSHATLEKAVSAIPFISTDETRHVLNGIHITTDGHIVATDGRKLAHAHTRGTQLPRDIILPTRMIKAFTALANGTVEGTGILYGPEHVRMQCWLSNTDHVSEQILAQHSGCYLRATLITGNYPNWRQVIPASFDTILDITPEFLAILQVTLARAKDKNTTTVTFELQANGTIIAAIRASTNPGNIDLIDPTPAGTHIISTQQPLFTTCYNATFLLCCLQFSGLRLHCQDERSTATGGTPDSAQTVLMPMRLN